MSEFRDAIANAIDAGPSDEYGICDPWGCADAISAMPEMEWLREFVQVEVAMHAKYGPGSTKVAILVRTMPSAIRAWIEGSGDE